MRASSVARDTDDTRSKQGARQRGRSAEADDTDKQDERHGRNWDWGQGAEQGSLTSLQRVPTHFHDRGSLTGPPLAGEGLLDGHPGGRLHAVCEETATRILVLVIVSDIVSR